jgi:hypothetical protein
MTGVDDGRDGGATAAARASPLSSLQPSLGVFLPAIHRPQPSITATRFIPAARNHLACLLLSNHAMRFVAVLLTFLPALAHAHSVLTSPTPRYPRDDIKDFSGAPCGGPRSTTVHVLTAGATLQVQWNETINHDGHFEVLFSMANDQGFTFVQDPSGVVLDNIAHSDVGTLPRPYSQMIKLPSQPCDACTLQVKQFMSASSSYYYTCADVRLVPPGSVPASGPVDMATTPPSPSGADAPSQPPPSPAQPPTATVRAGCAIAGGAVGSDGSAWLCLLLPWALRLRRACPKLVKARRDRRPPR